MDSIGDINTVYISHLQNQDDSINYYHNHQLMVFISLVIDLIGQLNLDQ